jgi:signal transduction histidine kinase
MERELRRLRSEFTAMRRHSEERGRSQTTRRQAEQAVFASLDKLQQFAGVARGEIGRLDYIVSQFLQALRPSAPKLVPADLNATVRETLDLLRPELENRGLLVVEDLQADLPSMTFDPDQIKQVLVNLIRNAMQAMTRGGTLSLATGRQGDGQWFSVADSGCGIPRETMNRLLHDGRIDVESHAGRGTRFRIWLREPPRVRLLTNPTK